MIALIILAAAASCADPVTQSDMTRCAIADYVQADARINRQWTVTYGIMKKRDAANKTRGGGPGYAAALLASQRAWLTFRDSQCVVEGLEVAGGSMQPMIIAGCRRQITDDRTKQLAELVESK